MSMIVSILETFLGQPRTHYPNKSQVGFDCPKCSEEKGLYDGDGKGNLAINYEKGVYKCWACWERNDMHGSIFSLIRKYGTEQNLRDYKLIAPANTYTSHPDEEEIVEEIRLPESFRAFSDSSPYYNNHNEAIRYMKSRGIGKDILDRFNIGYTVDGFYKNRIIIPSYDTNGELNYFTGRAFHKWTKPKYLNSKNPKDLIIFNEYKVNWNATIYLVEGPFDHIVTPNSIPLLGKVISDKLFYDLQTKANCDVVLVLDGGKEERKDSLFLYNKLNTVNLYNRVKVVYLKNGLDLSKIYEEGGPQRIVKTLKNAIKIKEFLL